MQVNIIYVGNIKDKFLADAVAEYEKRLSAYCKVQNTELKESRVPENASDAEVSAAIAEEGKRILAAMPKKGYKIALAVEGVDYVAFYVTHVRCDAYLVYGIAEGEFNAVSHTASGVVGRYEGCNVDIASRCRVDGGVIYQCGAKRGVFVLYQCVSRGGSHVYWNTEFF